MSIKFKSGQMYAIADIIVRLPIAMQDTVGDAFADAFVIDNPNFTRVRWQETLEDAFNTYLAAMAKKS